MLLLSLLGGHHDALHLVEEAAQAPLAVEVVPLQLLLALQQVGERLVLLAGTLLGVLIFGTIQSALIFDGRLNSWWLRIAIGTLLLAFILLQRFLTRGPARGSAG